MLPCSAIAGKISFSIDVGLSSILSIIEVLKRYSPALILSLIKCCGFSTNCSIYPFSFATTTPYLVGSSTLVTKIVPSLPWLLWNSSSFYRGKSQMTSELNTNKRFYWLSAKILSFASLMGPAVPIGASSMLTVNFTLYYRKKKDIRYLFQKVFG